VNVVGSLSLLTEVGLTAHAVFLGVNDWRDFSPGDGMITFVVAEFLFMVGQTIVAAVVSAVFVRDQ
jgi:hypothetical protein